MRRLACSLVVTSACSFTPGAVATGDGSIDTPPDTPVPPTPRWAIVGISRSGINKLQIQPFDDVHFGTACAEQPGPTYAYRSFLPHPSLNYAYGVEQDFEGIALGCTSITKTTLSGLGGARPLQRIVLATTPGTGFFTLDGSLAIGVYRYTIQPDGTPAASTSANAPSAAGALALDATNAQLYVAGTSAIYDYALTGAAMDFGTYTAAPMCTAPVDLLLSGSSVLAFCADAPDIRRYTTGTFAYDTTAGALGAVSQVVGLPGDRAVAARISPASLALLELHAGSPTWTDGPTLPTAVTAMAVSPDGKVLMTARDTDPTHAELAIWKISGSTITPVETHAVDGSVTALAITKPGT